MRATGLELRGIGAVYYEGCAVLVASTAHHTTIVAWLLLLSGHRSPENLLQQALIRQLREISMDGHTRNAQSSSQIINAHPAESFKFR
jgi:hypothetical protein